MKKYIMFCYCYGIGGGQSYVNGKVKYLKEQGWEVIVFPVKEKRKPGRIIWPYLVEYEKYASPAFTYSPFIWPKAYREKTLKKMMGIVGNNADEIIIESHNESFAVWGELLGKKVNAKNFAFNLEEQFDNYKYKDFFSFKFDRKELAGINIKSIPLLFKNYRDISESDDLVLGAIQSQDNILDYPESKCDRMKKLDWNIGYIGRSKQYAEIVVSEVIKFAQKHLDKTINFCILGELRGDWEKKAPVNLTITKLGFLVPMPRSYFRKLDVAIAGAGCARYSAFEGVETIIVDSTNAKSNGILGYTCFDTLFSSGTQEDISITLENVLVKQINKGKEFKFSGKPAANAETYYEKQFEKINNSAKDMCYYNFKNKYPMSDRVKSMLRFGFRWLFPKTYDFLLKKGIK